ncbi:MAG TPA: recombinase family protein [Polyangiales bacterium]|nr:recombinase family protein [Polyangiales bacterium]
MKVGSNQRMLVGYVRSTRDGAIPAAEDASLRNAGCEVVFADPCAGAAAEQQPELGKALESLGPQDVLLVTGLDRLAGGLRELIARMLQVQAKGASVRTLRGSLEPGSASAKDLLDALLSFEKQIAGARSRQKLKAAEEQSEQVGRPRLVDDVAVRLAASRAQAAEPVAQLARPIGASARKRRRGTASANQDKMRS